MALIVSGSKLIYNENSYDGDTSSSYDGDISSSDDEMKSSDFLCQKTDLLVERRSNFFKEETHLLSRAREMTIDEALVAVSCKRFKQYKKKTYILLSQVSNWEQLYHFVNWLSQDVAAWEIDTFEKCINVIEGFNKNGHHIVIPESLEEILKDVFEVRAFLKTDSSLSENRYIDPDQFEIAINKSNGITNFLKKYYLYLAFNETPILLNNLLLWLASDNGMKSIVNLEEFKQFIVHFRKFSVLEQNHKKPKVITDVLLNWLRNYAGSKKLIGGYEDFYQFLELLCEHEIIQKNQVHLFLSYSKTVCDYFEWAIKTRECLIKKESLRKQWFSILRNAASQPFIKKIQKKNLQTIKTQHRIMKLRQICFNTILNNALTQDIPIDEIKEKISSKLCLFLLWMQDVLDQWKYEYNKKLTDRPDYLKTGTHLLLEWLWSDRPNSNEIDTYEKFEALRLEAAKLMTCRNFNPLQGEVTFQLANSMEKNRGSLETLLEQLDEQHLRWDDLERVNSNNYGAECCY